MVVGAVAAGKSSLLAAIAGEIKKISGKVEIAGKCVATTQSMKRDDISVGVFKLGFFFWEPVAWVLNNTLRQNILFGSALDESKYNKIIQCCALDKDVKLFPGGHEQEIGESGINLSGGQKSESVLPQLF